MSRAAGWSGAARLTLTGLAPAAMVLTTRNTGLVQVSIAVGLPADFAVRRRLGVVHVMPHRFERLDVGKHRGEILIRHPAVGVPRHDLIEFPCFHVSGPDHLDKQ